MLKLCLREKMQKAQASLEYFIIFAVIAGLTLISAATFLPRVREAAEDLFNKAAGRISNPGNSPVTTPQPSPPEPPPNLAPTPTPTPPVIPPNAIPLASNKQHYGVNFPKGSETVYVIDIPPNTTRLRTEFTGCCSPYADETYLTWTLTLPDGRSFDGYVSGTEVSRNLYLIDNIPQGKALLTIKAHGDHNIVLLYIDNK